MKPIGFPGSNITFGKDQKEYEPLPAHLDRATSVVTIRWHMTWRERWRALVTGSIWQQVMTFNQPIQPQMMMVKNPIKRESSK